MWVELPQVVTPIPSTILAGNRLAFDGTYRYAYDAEGNRTAKFLDTNAGGTLSLGDTDVTVYAYDQRNRLVAVSHVNAWTSTQAAGLAAFTTQGTPLPGSDLELRYTYDYADRRIRRAIDADGQAGAAQENVSFAAYAGDIRTLEIATVMTFLLNGRAGFLGQVVQRNFYGNGVDEILAVDQVSWNTGTPVTSTFWTFTDHQDSVRDIVSGNAGTLGQVVEHRQYDSFGRIVRSTTGPQATAPATAGVGIDFGYAGRPLEARTGLSDNRARWYEPATGRFINEDPSGFRGGDANLFRYVGNDPLNKVDPSGLAAKWAQQAAKQSVPAAGWAGFGGTGQPAVSDPRPAVAIASRAGWSMQNQTAPTFTGKQDRGIPFGEFVLTRGNSPEPALPTSGFGARDAASLGVDFAPLPFVGAAKSAVELVAGYDYIAGKPTSRVFAAVGIFAGILPMGKGLLKGATKTIGAIGRTADDVADVARVAGRVDDAAAFVNNAAAPQLSNASDAVRQRVLARIVDSHAARASSTFAQFDRRVVARQFYGNAGFSGGRLEAHMQGIDFSKPVTVQTIPQGAYVEQWVKGGKVGNYFAPLGQAPEMNGISRGLRTPIAFQANQNVKVLQSHAAPLKDTWTLGPNYPVMTPGGGVQYFAPNQNAFDIIFGW